MNYKTLRRQARWLLSGGRRPTNVGEVWRSQQRELTRSITLVRIFYVICMFLTLSDVRGWDDWAEVEVLYPIWPIAWIDAVGVQLGIEIVLGIALISAILGALLPEYRLVRIAVVVGLLLQSALTNSLSVAIISHGRHAFIWIALWFVLLPNGSTERIEANRARRLRFTQVFWYAQATIMLFYTLGGLFKIAGGVLQFSQGLSHSFSIDALSRHAAGRILEGGQLPPYYSLGEIVVDYPWFGFMIFPPTIFLEALSFLVVFRPAIHRIWAAGLVGMHLGIFFSMSILFSGQATILGVMFLGSPFAPDKIVWKDVLYQLPVIGDMLSWKERGIGKTSPVFSTTDSSHSDS